MSIIQGRAGWRTSFPNQNKWPGQQKVNGAKPSIFLRDGGVEGLVWAANKSITTR